MRIDTEPGNQAGLFDSKLIDVCTRRATNKEAGDERHLLKLVKRKTFAADDCTDGLRCSNIALAFPTSMWVTRRYASMNGGGRATQEQLLYLLHPCSRLWLVLSLK